MAETPRKPLFERLQQGLEEGIAFSKGEVNLRGVEIQEDSPEVDALTLPETRND